MSDELEPGQVLVKRMGRDGRPKVVGQRIGGRIIAELERIVAQVEKPCSWPACPELHQVIAVGQEHVQVTDFLKLSLKPYVHGRLLPEVKVWHYSCLPPELGAAAVLLKEGRA